MVEPAPGTCTSYRVCAPKYCTVSTWVGPPELSWICSGRSMTVPRRTSDGWVRTRPSAVSAVVPCRSAGSMTASPTKPATHGVAGRA